MKDVRTMFSISDAMQMYGVKSRSTIWRWMKEGKLKPTRIGSRVYFTANAMKMFERRSKK